MDTPSTVGTPERPLGGLESFLLGQHARGAGWIARWIELDEHVGTDGVADAVEQWSTDIVPTRLRPDRLGSRGSWRLDPKVATVGVSVVGESEHPAHVVRSRLNRVADPLTESLCSVDAVEHSPGRCSGVVVAMSHSLVDGAGLGLITSRLAAALLGQQVGVAGATVTLAPALESVIGHRPMLSLARTAASQVSRVPRMVRSGAEFASARSCVATSAIDGDMSPRELASFIVSTYSTLRGRDVDVLRTIDVRRRHPVESNAIGYLAAGRLERWSRNGQRTAVYGRWEDLPRLHSALSARRHTPAPGVDLALSTVDVEPDSDVVRSTFGGPSVHGNGIPIHVVSHRQGDVIALTVVWNPTRIADSTAQELIQALGQK